MALSVTVGGAVGGCRRGPAEASASTGTTVADPGTVQETFQAMRVWYRQGAYTSMRPYIDPAETDNIIDMLLALDELMAANKAALQAVRDACPEADLKPFDLSDLRDWMDLFSREVTVVREDRDGDQAVLTVQTGNRMPLARLTFERCGARWVYLPGPVPRAAVVAVRRLTKSLERFRVVVRSQPSATAASLQNDYDLQVRPKLQQLARVVAAEDASAASR